MNQPSAQAAIHVLRPLSNIVGPATTAYFISPNTVLTLSGARGIADGVFYSSDKTTRDTWRQEITSAIDALKTLVDVYSFSVEEAKNPSGDNYVTYAFLLREGLQYSLMNTRLLSVSPDKLLEQATPPATLSQTIKDNLKESVAKQYSDQDRSYIATGLMLGYPDKAIIGSIGQWWHQGDPFASRMIEADIRGAGYYRCPQPVYSYPRSLAADPDIMQHEALWSGILKDFYESSFHQKLVQQADFQDKLRILGN